MSSVGSSTVGSPPGGCRRPRPGDAGPGGRSESRLDPETLASYAAVTARNLIVTKYRSDGRHRRHIHRLVEYNTIGDPEERSPSGARRMTRSRIALARVPVYDRELLLFREVDGLDAGHLAAHSDSTPGGIAMRLAGTRALCASS